MLALINKSDFFTAVRQYGILYMLVNDSDWRRQELGLTSYTAVIILNLQFIKLESIAEDELRLRREEIS